jgi:hypothetical protein
VSSYKNVDKAIAFIDRFREVVSDPINLHIVSQWFVNLIKYIVRFYFRTEIEHSNLPQRHIQQSR